MNILLNKKIRRYSGLIRAVKNWSAFLYYKTNSSGKSFTFRLRNSYIISVPEKMLPPFKEIFFDQVYLKGIPEHLLQKENPTILDIGANVGYFSLFMLFKFPKAEVYAFEPLPFNFRKILQYKKEYNFPNLHAINKAVGACNGNLSLCFSSPDSFTTMASIYGNPQKRQRLEVESTSLKIILEEHQIERVDFLKMDCEGAEYSILYATPPQVLEKLRVMSIEAHRGEEDGHNLSSLVAFLKQQGFSLVNSDLGAPNGYIWAWRTS